MFQTPEGVASHTVVEMKVKVLNRLPMVSVMGCSNGVFVMIFRISDCDPVIFPKNLSK